MNIPTPAAVKKQVDARKEREAELASSLANAKDKMPPTKGVKSSGTRPSDLSASSQKGKGSRDHSSSTSPRSSKSSPKQHSAGTKSRSNHESGEKVRTGTSKGSPSSTSSTRRTTTSSHTTREERSSTSTTARKNSSTAASESGTKPGVEAKKPFVRPDHLTTKPLRNNEALLGLKKSLEKPARGQFKREYRVGGRRSGKSQAVQNKKENN